MANQYPWDACLYLKRNSGEKVSGRGGRGEGDWEEGMEEKLWFVYKNKKINF